MYRIGTTMMALAALFAVGNFAQAGILDSAMPSLLLAAEADGVQCELADNCRRGRNVYRNNFYGVPRTNFYNTYRPIYGTGFNYHPSFYGGGFNNVVAPYGGFYGNGYGCRRGGGFGTVRINF